MSEINTVTSPEGFTITGNTQTEEAMSEQFSKPDSEATETPQEGSDGKPVGHQEPKAPEAPVSRAEAKRDMKARMLEATQKEAAAKKRAEEVEARALNAERELEELRRKAAEPPKPVETPKPAPVQAQEDPEPKEDDFESYSDYVKAAGRWAARQEHAEIAKKSQAESRASQFKSWQVENVKKFNERVSERAKVDPNLTIPQEVVALLPAKPFEMDHQMNSDDLIGAYFTNEEKGLDLMVYFRDNLEELGRIRSLPAPRVPIELARIEGRLSGATTATPPKPEYQRANPPVRPVTAVPPSADDPNRLPDSSLSAVEWGRKREALEERRRKSLSR